jgi:hypothetical protein
MKKIILIISVCLILISCHTISNEVYYPRRQFIDKIINNPDSLISLIDKSTYWDSVARHSTLLDDTLISYIPYIKKFKENGYSYIYYKYWPFESPEENWIILQDETKIMCRSNKLYLNFFFETKNQRWILYKISKDKKNTKELYDDFIRMEHE